MIQSNEPTIEHMNIAIAAFEGRKFYGHTIDKFGGETHNALPTMKYHISWNWLMPVVYKIANCIKEYKVAGMQQSIEMIQMQTLGIMSKLEDVYERVYQFIQWYNQQKQANE